MIAALLAYIPFLEPLDALQTWWYLLLVPLSFGIAVIYKAIRVRDLRQLWWEVAVMTVQIIIAMIGLAIALTILVQWVVPRLPAE